MLILLYFCRMQETVTDSRNYQNFFTNVINSTFWRSNCMKFKVTFVTL